MNCYWCREVAQADAAARLFSSNLTASYISHSELQGPRALAPGRWHPEIEKIIREDIRGRVSAADDAAPGEQTQLAAILEDEGRIVGVFLVTFSRAGAVPHAVLEDMVVERNARGKGYGSFFMKWIDQECLRRGIRRQFLESGIENHDAHHLFERSGFKQVSVVMMNEIS
jgi:GNAT superfamily N-acetyltransferase